MSYVTARVVWFNTDCGVARLRKGDKVFIHVNQLSATDMVPAPSILSGRRLRGSFIRLRFSTFPSGLIATEWMPLGVHKKAMKKVRERRREQFRRRNPATRHAFQAIA